mgnify:CR=1 FL=1
MKPTAFCLLSGGLDSVLAIELLKRQNIDIVAIHFISFFFDKSEKVKIIANDLNVPLKLIDISKEHLEMIKNPKYGYGKNFNPCIDCHALMASHASRFIDPEKKQFIATGEVLGQRPMSQNKQSLYLVEKHSRLKNWILRPLCAKNLSVTQPEELSWVDRNQLLDISGRGRKRQLELVKQWNLKIYDWPAGGCLLTDPGFSLKLKKINEMGLIDKLPILKAIQCGRFLVINDSKVVIISRSEEEGKKLNTIQSEVTLIGSDTPGPMIKGFGKFDENDKIQLGKIFNYYSKSKGKSPVKVLINDKLYTIDSIMREEIKDFIKKGSI